MSGCFSFSLFLNIIWNCSQSCLARHLELIIMRYNHSSHQDTRHNQCAQRKATIKGIP